MLIYLILCLPTTVYSLLSCKESCEACVAPSDSNPPEVQKVYCSMCLECRGQRSRFDADNMLLRESPPFEAPIEAPPALEEPVPEANVEADTPNCPGGKCREHSKEADKEPDNNDKGDKGNGGATTCPPDNCQQHVPTICITIPPWLCPTTTTITTTTVCQTTCRMFTDCGGCGRRQMEENRRHEQPDVYVAFPKGGNPDGNYVYKKLKRGMRPDYL